MKQALPKNAAEPAILALNGGSSSIRFAVYEAGDALNKTLHGKIDRIGLSGSRLSFEASGTPGEVALVVPDHRSAARLLLDWLDKRPEAQSLIAVGHRVVYGMQHSAPKRITLELLDELKRLGPYDPDHLPSEIGLIGAVSARYPQLPQLACFDTAFHHDMPRVARMLAIPRRYEAQGVQRYGFHGLSYAFLMEELARLGDAAASKGRVILAHLGNGASLAAVRDGQSIDTSMGFTPASGLPMSTRSGDLDPGLFSFLARSEQMSAMQFQSMVNHESGLLGISETSADLRDLLAVEASDVRAAEAVAMFCYQAKKGVGAYAAALGGLDTLVFAGGIGENAAVIRERICEGLGFLGIELDAQRNAQHAPLISRNAGRVKVRVLRTDEQLMIARSVHQQHGRKPGAQ